MFGSILVATDGSPTAELALERAVALASRLGAALHAVSVVPDLDVAAASTGPGGAALAQVHQRHEEGAAAALARAETMAGEQAVPCTAHLEQGNPAACIVAVADRLGVDLVVVGSKGLNPAGHYVIGSVAEQVLLTGRDHHVLVIRTTP
jgi:nucleotide-binding universal stress UspA family protein